MIKVALVVVALVASYFLFVHGELPSKIVFQGHTLQKKNKEIFERVDGKFAIYTYRDKQLTNFLVLVLAENDAVVPVDEINDYYIKRLEQQGFKLALNKKGRYLGYQHADNDGMAQVYMTYADAMDGVIVYVRATEQKVAKKREVESLFVELENFTF